MKDHDCTYCDHFSLAENEPAWSEYTPGADAHIECYKGYWSLGSNGIPWTPKGFRLAVIKGETCKDFKRTDDL